MEESYISEFNTIDEEISLRELFNVLLHGKWIIISILSFASIIAVIYSLSLPNIYASKALLYKVDSSSSISGSLGSYSGLASLAGINIPSADSQANGTKALKTITSLNFFKNNVMPEIFLPDLMSVDSWDHTTNTLVYDEKIYDINTKSWVRDYDYPSKQIPSAQESYAVFLGKHLSISEDKKTGLITLTMRHQSPYTAKKWSDLLIREVNDYYREKDKTEAQKAVIFLNNQIKMTNLSEIKQVIAELLKQQTQKLALIEANQSYVFDYIDPPAVMERKSEPKRSIICILGFLLGLIISIFVVLLKHYGPSKKSS
jgi:LPS O-antigen subunit length determinant protein (WzzB/FepE family)